MKVVLIAMGTLVLLLGGLALSKGTDTFMAGLKGGGMSLVKFLPILLVVFVVMGFIEVLIPEGFTEKWLSDAAGWRGIGIAWLAGILTPAGSIMGFPIVAALYKAGTGVGVLVTYVTSLSTLALIRVPLEVGFYGFKLTAIRVAACLFLPPISGAVALGIAALMR